MRLWYAISVRDSRRIMYERTVRRLVSSLMEGSFLRSLYLRSPNVDSMSSRAPKISGGSGSRWGQGALAGSSGVAWGAMTVSK